METGSEADAILARGGSLREVGRCFGSKAEGLAFYGGAMQERYPVQAGGACCVCGAGESQPYVYTWGASFASKGTPSSGTALAMDVVLLLMGMVRIRTTATVVTFATSHGLCERCRRQQALKRAAANVLQFFSLLVGIISALVGPLGIAGYFYFRNDPQSRHELWGWLLTGVGGLAALGLCAWGMSLTHKLRVPAPLRGIPQFPFRFVAVQRAGK